MTKFVRVTNPPHTLVKGEITIGGPDFLPQIEACSRRKGHASVIGVNYIRDVLDLVGQTYIGPDFSTITSFNLTNYKGLAAPTNADVHRIIMEIITKQQPSILEAYLDKHIRARPLSANLIYYTGPRDLCTRFLHWGIAEVLVSELDKDRRKALKEKSSDLEHTPVDVSNVTQLENEQ